MDGYLVRTGSDMRHKIPGMGVSSLGRAIGYLRENFENPFAPYRKASSAIITRRSDGLVIAYWTLWNGLRIVRNRPPALSVFKNSPDWRKSEDYLHFLIKNKRRQRTARNTLRNLR